MRCDQDLWRVQSRDGAVLQGDLESCADWIVSQVLLPGRTNGLPGLWGTARPGTRSLEMPKVP